MTEKKLRISLLISMLILPVIVQAGPGTRILGGEVSGTEDYASLMEHYESLLEKEVFDLVKKEPSFAEKSAIALNNEGKLQNYVELSNLSLEIRRIYTTTGNLEKIEKHIKETLPPIIQTASYSSIQTASDSSSRDVLKNIAYHALMAKLLISTKLRYFLDTERITEKQYKKIVNLVSETAKTAISKKRNSCQISFKEPGNAV